MFGGEVFLDGVLTFEKPIHGCVAVFVDVDGAFATAEAPEGGVGGGLREGKFASLMDDAPDDHGEAVPHPRLVRP